MEKILLHPHAVMSLILCLTAGMIILSFSSLKKQAPWTRWLIAASVGVLGWQLDNVITFGIEPGYLKEAPWRKWELIFVFGLSSVLLLISQIQLAYLFPTNPYKRERKRVVWGCVIGLAGSWLYYSYYILTNPESLGLEVSLLFAIWGLFIISWTLVVYLRKALYFRKNHNREAMTACLLLMVMELFFIASIAGVLRIDPHSLKESWIYVDIYSPGRYWTYFLFTWLGILGGAMLFIIFSTVPITFQVRLVGFTFVLVMIVLSVVVLTFFPPFPPDNLSQRAKIQQNLIHVSGLILMATFLVALVYPIILRASIIIPLERLLVGVNKVREGAVDTKVRVTSNDEIGLLTENFNQMTGTLKQARAELASYAADLEKKVEERTMQLQESLEYLKATQAQLIRREKMASLGELMAGIAHEIQNPLNFVNNFSESSIQFIDEWKAEEAKPVVDEELCAEIVRNLELTLKKINEHGKRADAIVKNMQLQSRISSGLKEPTDLNQLANEYLRLSYQGYCSKKQSFRAKLHTQLDPALMQVPVVVQDVSRVFVNLFNNAYYAIDLKLKAGVQDYEPSLVLTSRQLPDCIEMRVHDNGVGIPESLQQKIFQPFFTTKPTGQGTGLGLALAYDIIINDHGGTIDLTSKEGEFTEFFFTVPTA
jgi:two-component system, NtrC family, sensor kinase